MKKKKNSQTQTDEFRAKFTTLLHCETREKWPKVIRTPTLIHPVTVQQQPPDDKHPQGYTDVNWNHVDMLNLNRFKETVVSYGMNSPFVRQMLNSWSTRNRSIPQNWKDLVTAVLESGHLVFSHNGDPEGERS